MDVYSYECYKPLLKDRLKETRTRKKNWTFKKIADHLGMQATYLSKVLNSDQHHLAEEDLWLTCKSLDFFPEEAEYILLLRSQATAKKSERKTELGKRIEALRTERKISAQVNKSSSSTINNEMEYLLNPMCIILHVALNSPVIRKDVRGLGTSLGLKVPQLRDLLRVLERNDLIKLDPTDSLEVTEVMPRRLHFAKDHPLMRTNQNLFKAVIQSKLSATSEDEKQSLQATFTLDQPSFEEIKKEFQVFLRKVEAIQNRSRHKEVYQLCFDLFRWV